LDKGIIALHVNSDQVTKGLKEHLKVFPLGGLFVKVDDKERFGWLNVPSTVIFLALDSSISPGELNTECIGDIFHFPEE
jgi:hypothetical protein